MQQQRKKCLDFLVHIISMRSNHTARDKPSGNAPFFLHEIDTTAKERVEVGKTKSEEVE